VQDKFLEFRSLMDCNINLFLRVTFTTIILNIEHKLVLIFHLSRTKSSHYEQYVRYCLKKRNIVISQNLSSISDVGGFLRDVQFPPPIKLTTNNTCITEVVFKIFISNNILSKTYIYSYKTTKQTVFQFLFFFQIQD
jgi:hypothetical protein